MDLIDRIRKDIDDRLEELSPQVEEIPRLEGVLAALSKAGDGGASRDATSSRARGAAKPRRRGASASKSTRRARPQKRARRGQRREELLELINENPEITVSEAARQMGVAPPQVSTLVRRLEEEGVIQRAGGRFVLVAPPVSEAGDEGRT